MPKHIALAMSVHHLTGSAKIVSLLNIFGQASSVSHTMEVQCVLTEKQLHEQAQEEVYFHGKSNQVLGSLWPGTIMIFVKTLYWVLALLTVPTESLCKDVGKGLSTSHRGKQE